MEGLKIVKISNEMSEIISCSITELIDKEKDNASFEGAYYICAGTSSSPLVNLGIAYSDGTINLIYLNGVTTYEKTDIEGVTDVNPADKSVNSFDLQEGIINKEFINEIKKIEWPNLPLDFQFRYGRIIYDKNGVLTKIKQSLEKESDIEVSPDCFRDACQIEPTIRYKGIPNFKEINDLVRNEYYFEDDFFPHITFSDLRQCYNELTTQIEKILEAKKVYDELIAKGCSEEGQVCLKSELDMYNLAHRSNPQDQHLINALLGQYPDLKEYIDLLESLGDLQTEKYNILTRSINFRNFGGDNHIDDKCYPNHAIVKNEENDLECLFCGATSKEYGLSKEETDFLEMCAEKQGMFLKEVTKDYLPFIQILIEKRKERLETRTPYYEIEDEDMSCAEEQYLEDESVVFDMRLEINRALMLDAGILETRDYRISNPKFLSPQKTKKLLKAINEQISILENGSSETRNLQLEICQTYKYEVLILSGNNIPALYAEAKSEEEKIALTKAYYNISSSEYRINSGYFNSNHAHISAASYICRTAQPEINKKILEMKYQK